MKRHSFLFVTLLATSAVAQSAAPASPLGITLSQALVTTVSENGKQVEKLTVNPKQVSPGAVLIQTAVAKNSANAPLTGVSIKVPVPANTVYMAPEGVWPAEVRAEYSLDGKTFAAAPLHKQVTVNENGKPVTKQVEVKPSEYKAVRWTLGTLAAGEQQKLAFRVRVN